MVDLLNHLDKLKFVIDYDKTKHNHYICVQLRGDGNNGMIDGREMIDGEQLSFLNRELGRDLKFHYWNTTSFENVKEALDLLKNNFPTIPREIKFR